MRFFTLLLILISLNLPSIAEPLSADNEIVTGNSTDVTLEHKIVNSRVFQMSYIAVPLITAGCIVKGDDEQFQALRNEYMPEFQNHTDDYLQYAPAALMVSLKAAGVGSRSSWGRMLTADALSVAIMSASVNTLKYTVKTKRPDSSANNSFPSGHTATAFMTATMLHKEYGMVSPWYSIIGYTTATATGIMRMTNNRHWLSDIMVGAGIGILSTELGYFLSDLIFKDRGIDMSLATYVEPSWYDIEHPSSIGLYLGLIGTPGLFTLDNGDKLSIQTGSRVGFEGAYFFNKIVGLGGRFTISNTPIIVNNVAQSESLATVGSSVGGYFALPLSPRWRVSSKALVNCNFFERCRLDNSDELSIGEGYKFGVGTGAAIEYLSNERWSMKIFSDYDLISLQGLPNKNLHHVLSFGFTGSVIIH